MAVDDFLWAAVVVVAADMDGNGVVDVTDVAAMISAALQRP